MHFYLLLWDTLLEPVIMLSSHIEISRVGIVADHPAVQLTVRINCQACEQVSLLMILAFSHQVTRSFQATPFEMNCCCQALCKFL